MPNESKDNLPNNEHLLGEFNSHSTEEWRSAVDKLLKGKPYEKILLTKTYEGLTLQPIYRKEDLEKLEHTDNLPGFPPYVRSTKTTGFLKESWKVAQEIPYPTPEEFNKALLHDLNRGQTAVNLVLDDTSKDGLDPDPSTAGEVGRNGTSISTMSDLEVALDKIVLDCIDIRIDAPVTSLPIAAMLIALAEKKDIKLDKIQGVIGADPISYLLEKGNLPTLYIQTIKELIELTKWSAKNTPSLRTISIKSYAFKNSGANIIDELSFSISTAIEYIRELQNSGLSIDEIAPKIEFCFALGSNFFMEIAKIRAARAIWSNVVKAFGGNAESQKMYIHARTATYNKTQYDPYVNMLRTTTEAFSGIIGGIDSMHVGAFDEILRNPDEFSRRIARNQQIILNEECHFNHVIDPAGGSWYIETLTDTFAKEVWTEIQKIENMGGIIKAIKENYPQNKISETAEARKKNLSTRKDSIIGTNKYANMTEKPLEADSTNYPEVYCSRYNKIKEIKKELTIELKEDAIFDNILEAVKQGATLNQLTSALWKDTEKVEVSPLNIHRSAEFFEKLRQEVEASENKPKVFLANMGPIPQHKPRADFTRGFFEVGGFEVIGNSGFKTPEEAAEAAIKSGAQVVVICSTDPTYPEIVPAVTSKIKEHNPEIQVILAGYPKDQIETHKASGIDDFIHIRANAYNILSNILKKDFVRNYMNNAGVEK